MKKLIPLSLFLSMLVGAAWGQCTTTIATYPYFENFDSGPGGWTTGSLPGAVGASSWALGTPTSGTINSAASPPNSWKTNLSGNYNNEEDSYVLSPCFNFSTLVAPIFSAKIWWNSESGWDGTVLQSSIDGGLTWQVVGTVGAPNNWFNTSSINGTPGAQSVGWAGNGTTGSSGWVIAKHNLTGLGGQANVRLRFAFGSDFSVNSYDGFAFDDVAVIETPTVDLQVSAFTSPGSSCNLTATENVCITIINRGIAAQNNFPVSYQIGSNAPVTETVTTSIAPGASYTYCFNTKANLSVNGNYTITATHGLAGDGDPSNNSVSTNITSVPVISSFPYSQNFENGQGGWRSGGTNSSWGFGTPAGSVIQGAASGVNAWKTNLTGNYNNAEQSWVMSPCFNFAGLTGDPDFEFKIWWNSEGGWDGAVLQSSINGGTTWQNVGTVNAPNNWFNTTNINGNPGGQAAGWAGNGSTGSAGWVKAKHKLTGLAGQSSVLLRMAFGSDGSVNGYDGVAFDDIRIGDNSHNVAINTFVPLTQVCGFGTNERVEVEIENLGGLPITNYDMRYSLDGGTTWITHTGNKPTLMPDTPIRFVFAQGADLSAPGAHSILVEIVNNQGVDPELGNNTITYNITNALYTSMPINLDFETPPTSIAAARSLTKSRSNITEVAGTGSTGKGLVMDGIDNAAWEIPVGLTNPWTNNPDHFAGVFICLGPANIGLDTLRLTLDLRQFYKGSHYNTNFRVTVNGKQVGMTYNPPFGGYPTGTPAPWQTIVVDLTPYKNSGGIQVGLESSVREPYANGTGTANVIDNIKIERILVNGIKENPLQRNLVVFPNPSTGQFNLKVPVTTRNYTLEVTDLTGKVVKQQTVTNNNGNAQLNLNNTAKGVYILKIVSEGNIATRKLIVE